MMNRLSIICLFLLFARNQAQYASCPICKDGSTLLNPDDIIQIPTGGGGEATCAQIDMVSTGGFLEPSICSLIQSVIFTSFCQCGNTSENVTSTPTSSPIKSSTSAPTTTEDNSPCYVCEEENTVEFMEKVITIPVGDKAYNTTCYQVEQLGLATVLNAEQCGLTTKYLTTIGCGCVPKESKESYEAPTAPVCAVCGEGYVISSPRNKISVPPGFIIESATCFQIEQVGLIGLIPSDFCEAVQDAVKLAECNCIPSSTEAPSIEASDSVSEEPSDVPSDVPTTVPVSAPVKKPWSGLWKKPTVATPVWKKQTVATPVAKAAKTN